MQNNFVTYLKQKRNLYCLKKKRLVKMGVVRIKNKNINIWAMFQIKLSLLEKKKSK